MAERTGHVAGPQGAGSGQQAQAEPRDADRKGDDPLPPGAVVMEPIGSSEEAVSPQAGQAGVPDASGSSGAGAASSGAGAGSEETGARDEVPQAAGAKGPSEADSAAEAGGRQGSPQSAPQKTASRLGGQPGQPGAWQDGTPDAWGGPAQDQDGQSQGWQNWHGQQGQQGQQDQQDGWHQGPETWGDIPEEGEAGAGLANPWDEAPRPSGWLSAFYQTCIRAMFAPARFFSSLTPRPVLKALAFYLVVCTLQMAMQQVWAQVFLSYIQPLAGSDPQLQKMAEALAGQDSFALSLLLRLAALTLQLYLFSGLLTLAWRIIAPGRASYSVIFQVLAYAEAPGILCLVPAVGTVAGLIWGLACMLIGSKAAFGLTWGQTLLGFLPLALLLLPSLMQVGSLLGV